MKYSMKKQIEILSCPTCGSQDLTERVDQSQMSFPYAGSFNLKEIVNTCRVCGTEGDFAKINEAAIEAVEEEAKKIGVENILANLNDQGYSMAYMERSLDLPQRTMMRWKTGECSASSLALLRLVRTYPWLLKVAESRFDYIKSMQILCNEGIKTIGNLINVVNPSARVQVTVGANQAEQVTFTTPFSTSSQLNYPMYQNIQFAGGSVK